MSGTLSLLIFDQTRYKELASSIRGPDQRTAGGVQEAKFRPLGLPLLEPSWCDVLEDFEVPFGRLHVLPEGQAVDTGRAEIWNNGDGMLSTMS